MDRKIVVVRRRTRLEDLIARFNTVNQARFYMEHLGADFDDYQTENVEYQQSLAVCAEAASRVGRVQILDRSFLPNFLFGPDDIVVALGQDGMVANTLKYLQGQPLVGVNPSPTRWDGILAPFAPGQLESKLAQVASGRAPLREIAMAQATLADGQILLGVNDLFIGQKTHVSARYELTVGDSTERQSSSGIIVSTGLGSTGWMRSVVETAAVVSSASVETRRQPWDVPLLRYAVREAFPSRATGTTLVHGFIDQGTRFEILSQMPENGVVFSDGIESDFLEFNSGSRVAIGVAPRKGVLVAG